MPDTRRPLEFEVKSTRRRDEGSFALRVWRKAVFGLFSGKEKVRFAGGSVSDDAMEKRLKSASSAGTPMTADERAKLEESREDFRNGRFTVDPETTRSQRATGRR